MRSTKGVWLIMGYILAFFLLVGRECFRNGSVDPIHISKIFCLYLFFQMVETLGRSEEIWKMGVAVSGHCFVIFTLLLLSIEDRNIFKVLGLH